MSTKGLLIVLSGPSGSGKDTVLERVHAKDIPIQRSISMTTRQKRDGETDGVDYYFVTKDYFEKQIAAKNMLESAIYSSNYYGTPKGPVDKWLDDGKTVVLKIEVQGAEKRLRNRETDSEEAIRMRMDAALGEMQCSEKYDYIVFNDILEDTVEDICSIIKAEKLKSSKMKYLVREVIKNA